MRRNLKAEILAWGEERDIFAPGKPEVTFSLPKDIGKLTLDDLGDLYWNCGRTVDYIKSELSMVETDLGQLQGESKRLWARLWKEANERLPKTGKGTVGGKEAIDAEIYLNDEYADLMEEIELVKGKKNYAESVFESLRRAAGQISREFARRNIKIAAAFGPDGSEFNAE